MRCKVNNRITLLEVHGTTPKVEVMEVVEDMKEEEDIEVEEEVEENLAKDEDGSSVITVDNKVTLHETAQRLPVPTTKLPIMLLKNVQCC